MAFCERKHPAFKAVTQDDQDDMVLEDDAMSTVPTEEDGIHSVVPGLYLSGIQGASELWKLKALKIRQIINCSDKSNIFDDHPLFRYTRVVLDDVPAEASKLTAALDTVVDTIHGHLHAGEAVLVHCTQGASRSVSFVVAYLVKHHSSLNSAAVASAPTSTTITTSPVSSALAYVCAKRACAKPNVGFMEALHQWSTTSMAIAATKTETGIAKLL